MLFRSKVASNETIRFVFKVETAEVTVILKVVSCDLEDPETIKEIKEEYEFATKAYKIAKEGVARPIDIKDIKDDLRSEHIIEMLFEYCGTNLLAALKDADTKTIMDAMMQVALTMAKLEEKKIFHSDLKPENLAILNGVVKVLDFGISMSFDKKSQMLTTKTMKGATFPYLAPEVFGTYKGHPTPVDVYAWGISLYQLLTNKSMDDLERETELRMKDYKGFLKNVENLKVKANTPPFLKQKAIKILLQTLSFNPKERPSFGELTEEFMGEEQKKNINELYFDKEKDSIASVI